MKVKPIYKNGDKVDFNNNKLRSLLPTISKIFEHVIHTQLYKYLSDHNFRGDLNLHLDITTNPHTRQFTNLLACSGLKQHVNDPTHINGHTLDILITRDSSDVVSNVGVIDIGLSENDVDVILSDTICNMIICI